jgi:UDP-glucose 4-epimerase
MKKNSIVIGGSGFLGSHIADALTHLGHNVIVADLQKSDYVKETQTFIQCDILDQKSIEALFKEKIDYVYHFAGKAAIEDSRLNPKDTFNLNVIGTINVLNACIKYKIKRFVFASSAYAYSNSGSFYGISKFTSEKIIKEFQKLHNLSFTCIRYGSLYGPRATEDNGMYQYLSQALAKKSIIHQGTGEEIREYIHVLDAATMSTQILENKYENKFITLTGMEKIKQKDLLIMIKEIMNDDLNISFKNSKINSHYQVTPYSFYAETASKLVANPFIDLGQGIVDYLEWLSKNNEFKTTHS